MYIKKKLITLLLAAAVAIPSVFASMPLTAHAETTVSEAAGQESGAVVLTAATVTGKTAAVSGKAAAAKKTAVKIPSVKLNKQSVILDVAKKAKISASVKNSKKSDLSWSSSNKKVAVVDKNGVIVGKGNGTCTVTAKIKGTSKKASCKVKVRGYKTYVVKTTAYCNCRKCCGRWAGGRTASGTYPKAGRTIAVDKKLIPLGSKVEINGHTYIAEDTGSAIKGKKIDIYFDSHSAALRYGTSYQTVKVYE